MSWDRVPLFLVFCGIGGVMMLPVAFFAAINGSSAVAWTFLVNGIVLTAFSVIVALARNNRPLPNQARQQLFGLFGSVTALPLFLAVPLSATVPSMTYLDAYVEMVSCITTTGLTLVPIQIPVDDSIHLFRALTGWMGGFAIWVAAISIFSPLRLGGFELMLPPVKEQLHVGAWGRDKANRSSLAQLRRHTADLAPIYGGLTFLLWVLLLMIGEDPFVALCHAMSTLATSGITPLLNFSDSDVHVGAELVIFAFFAFALTRRSFSSDLPSTARMPLRRDPELRVALAVILMTVLVLVARHWYVAAELRTPPSFALAIQALWGGVFTSLSFLTTTGFVSDNWSETQLWSSITTPGALLMGLALVGGGVATTAGGVKLLRIYVLYKHGQQEVSRLIHPSSVGGLGSSGRWVPAQAAFMAWLFFMIVALSITTTMLALSATGLDFETSTVLTLAAISTTGPLTDVAISPPIDLRNLDIAAKLLLAGAMALGRLETLAIIALLNPDFWRK